MRLVNEAAGRCLRRTSRLFDLFAIVLVSAGINVVTGAGGSEFEALALASGIALATAGALLTAIKNRCEVIARCVDSSIALESQAVDRMLAGKRQDSGPRGLAMERTVTIAPRSEAEHVTSAVDVFLANPRNARRVAAQCLLSVFLTAAGMAGTFWSLYATENADSHKSIETATRTANQQIVGEIAQLRMELASLASVVSNNCGRLVTPPAAETNLPAEPAKTRGN